MAVSVLAVPPTSPTIISASYSAVYKLSSNVYGTAGVTQFRFLAEIVAGPIDLGSKYTVVSESPNVGYIDMANTFRELIALSAFQYQSVLTLPSITIPEGDDAPTIDTVSVLIKEQYFLNGVFTENTFAGGAFNHIVARGFSDDANKDWIYDNWWRYNGLEDFFPFSGKMPVIYRTFAKRDSWPSTGSEPWLNIRVNRLNDNFPMYDLTVQRTLFELSGAFYYPITSAASDNDAFTGVHIRVGTRPTAVGTITVQDDFNIERNVAECEDPETLLMFQDRFFQWAFMSFTKKSYVTMNAQPQRTESPNGRYRYNVDTSDVILLNTDFVPEGWNPLFRDIIATEKAYLVASDGSLEEVTTVPNSFRFQTSRNDNLIQYSISVRKSVDNFNP